MIDFATSARFALTPAARDALAARAHPASQELISAFGRAMAQERPISLTAIGESRADLAAYIAQLEEKVAELRLPDPAVLEDSAFVVQGIYFANLDDADRARKIVADRKERDRARHAENVIRRAETIVRLNPTQPDAARALLVDRLGFHADAAAAFVTKVRDEDFAHRTQRRENALTMLGMLLTGRPVYVPPAAAETPALDGTVSA